MKTALRLVLLLFAAGTIVPASAQYTALWQDFNGFSSLTIGAGWTQSWSGVIPWRAEEPYLPGCLGLPGTNGINKVAYIVECGWQNDDNSSVLMKTPMLDFTGHSGMYLRFGSHFHEQTDNGHTEEATIEVSTNGGASWTVVKNIHHNGWLGKYETQYVDLGAFSYNDSIKIGFRYNDHGLFGGGWSVDNVKVYKPAQHDVMLVTATPDSALTSYCVVGDSAQIGGTVYNAGLQPVTEFDAHYQLATGTGPVYTVHYANLSLASFDTMSFQHPKRFVMSGFDKQDLKVWLTAPLDTIYTNDTLPVSIRGAAFLPRKTVLLEVSSSTLNKNEPQSITYMRGLEQSDYPVALVAVHQGDPMEDSAYTDFIFNFRQHYIPYYFFDRRVDASVTEMTETFHRLRTFFGFADLSIHPYLAHPGKVDLNIEVKPAVTLRGRYRLALILKESGVHGAGSVWSQANWYSGGFLGPMGGFESLPDPVSYNVMRYDWVGRSLFQEDTGAGCLPDSMAPNGIYSCRLRATLREDWVKNNMTAIVALIRLSDSSVLNTTQLRLASLGVGETAGAGPDLRLYPNPAGASATLVFESASNDEALVSVTDITGRVLYRTTAGHGSGSRELAINTGAWPSGMYLVTLHQGASRSTRKLQVLH